MKKSMTSPTIGFSFNCRDEADAVFDKAKKIAETYGYITKADMFALCEGTSTDAYEDLKAGWTPKALSRAYTEKNIYHNESMLYLPDFDYKMAECTEEIKEPQPEPIDVSITLDKHHENPGIIEQTIQALFKDPEKIKDRPIFISIM